MEVAYAMLANSAEVSSDGKLYLMGADLNQVVGEFPLTIPHMDLVAKIILLPEECDKQYRIVVHFVGPKQQVLEPQMAMDFTSPPAPPPETELQGALSLFISINGLMIPEPGVYWLRILVGDQEIKKVKLRAYGVESQRPLLRQPIAMTPAQPPKE